MPNRSEIERQIAEFTSDLIAGIRPKQHSEMWNLYIYLRVAGALLEECGWEIAETHTQLLNERDASFKGA
jgi:hypothetical protein